MNKAEYQFVSYAIANFPVRATHPRKFKNIVTAHFHSDAEIIKVIKGSVEARLGTSTYILNEGDLAFCTPHTVHEVITLCDDAEIQGFIFDPQILDNIVDFNVVRDTHIVFNSSSKSTSEVSRIFDDLHKTYMTAPVSFKLRIKAELMLLASVLIEENFIFVDIDAKKKFRTTPAVLYIRNNYSQPITIRELASLVNLCDDTFIRVFKKEHGQTPFSYIMNFRITEALKLLLQNELSIAEIALHTGFSSSSYFTKIFKKKLNISPIQYKKIYLSH
ncbi:MAG: helix-turn-helix transcriptional regulator [Clostridia bacterium]|nr:helix-turn-helix transcriptional regulator [Clostridia bacterium]